MNLKLPKTETPIEIINELKKECGVCKISAEQKKLHFHHIDYEQGIGLFVCPSCHRKIYEGHYPELKPINKSYMTVIRIDKKTFNYLQTKKIIPEEPYYKVLKRLLGLEEKK
jgi:hypothetical protein